ncbi:unnamed protein product [Polarella glacialis]|uniref:Uncharacterized protein n=1 Tax=Polarella glacialis TaxID=89957 RepID=A0A813JEQ5_POLGL|nr:unnamed protein product [Polarella glacialis]
MMYELYVQFPISQELPFFQSVHSIDLPCILVTTSQRLFGSQQVPPVKNRHISWHGAVVLASRAWMRRWVARSEASSSTARQDSSCSLPQYAALARQSSEQTTKTAARAMTVARK